MQDYGYEYFDGEGDSPVRGGYHLADFGPRFRAIAKTIADSHSPNLSLDVACAKGFLVYAMQEQGHNAIGVDISDYAVSHSPLAIRGRLLLTDVDRTYLPFRDASFDLVTMADIVEHLHNPERIAAEASRVLRIGGTMYVRTTKAGDRRSYIDPGHISVRTKKAWINMFEAVGFQIRSSQWFLFKTCIEESMTTIRPTGHTTVWGRILGRLGAPGRRLRGLLKFAATPIVDSNYWLVFRLASHGTNLK